ncbi:TPA: hypothetical protein RUS85_004760 [Citrobacter amalonaticus]|nr:hypothetical protein [Citrobacter amalonaticus]
MMKKYDPNTPLVVTGEIPQDLQFKPVFDIKIIGKDNVAREAIEALLTEIAKIKEYRKGDHHGREIMIFSVHFFKSYTASEETQCVAYREDVIKVLGELILDVDVTPTNIY